MLGMEKEMETTIMENQMEKKMENEMETGLFLLMLGWVGPGIFNVFPNGFNRGPYILIFFNGF